MTCQRIVNSSNTIGVNNGAGITNPSRAHELSSYLGIFVWLIIGRESKNGRQYNGQKKKNNNLQNTTQKTKDLLTRTPLKTGGYKQYLFH